MSVRGRVEGVPGDFGREVVVSVVHSHAVHLFFVTLDTVRGSNIVPEDPSLTLVLGSFQLVYDAPC